MQSIHSRLLLPALLLATAAAQNPLGTTVPLGLRGAFGAASWDRPFAAAPNRHQQVFLGSELPARLDIRGIALRKDDRINSYGGRTIDVEIKLAHTHRDAGTMAAAFDQNFDAGAPTVVLPRRQVRLQDMPWNPPESPYEFFAEIDFVREFAFDRSRGNLLLEVVVYGNDANNQAFLYPLDSGANLATTSVYANGPTATSGVVSRNGIAVRFVTPNDRKAAWQSSWQASGPQGRTAIGLSGGNPPLAGGVATFDLYAPGWDVAGVVVSAGVRTGQNLPMPGYRLAVAADLARTLTVLPLPLQGGFQSVVLPLPAEASLAGLDVAFQGITTAASAPNLLGSSNLLLANVGMSLFGSAEFAITNGPFDIARQSNLVDANGNVVVVHRAAAETPDKIVIQGTKQAGVGPLQIHVTNPPRVIDIPAGQSTYSVTVTVSPGGEVHLYNADAANTMNGVTYEVSVVD